MRNRNTPTLLPLNKVVGSPGMSLNMDKRSEFAISSGRLPARCQAAVEGSKGDAPTALQN